MRDRTLRTISASVVLAGITIAGFIQLGNDGDPSLAEIGPGEPSTTATDGRASSQSETSTTAPTPFVYRVGLLSGITTDNFWAFYGEQPSAWNAYVLGPTKPALLTADAARGGLRPELAASEVTPTFNEEGWRVRVDLSPHLAWSDGEPITAHDLVFTFETVRALDLGGSWAEAFPATIESIHADDAYHVRIEFTERPRLADWPHGVGTAPIMPRHIWGAKVEGLSAGELYDLDGSGDVGGGALALDDVTDEVIISEKNPGYSPASAPDTVEYRVFADEAAAVAALGRGDIDSILSPKGLAGEGLDAVESGSVVEILNSPGNAVRYLGFNLERDPMSDKAFRKALALLIERGELAETINGAAAPAWSLVPEANKHWFDDEAADEIAGLYDGPRAKRLQIALEGLTAAGYAWSTAPTIAESGELVVGKGLTINGRAPQPLTILTPGDAYDPARPDYVREIAATLGVLGFDARPVETDFDSVVDLAFTPDENGSLHYDMYVLGWTLGNPALPGYYEALFAPDGAMNNTGYSSKAFVAALDAYEGSFSEEEAFDALWEMERVLAGDLPYLPLYTSEITEAYRADRVSFRIGESLGGLQARLGGIWDVAPVR